MHAKRHTSEHTPGYSLTAFGPPWGVPIDKNPDDTEEIDFLCIPAVDIPIMKANYYIRIESIKEIRV